MKTVYDIVALPYEHERVKHDKSFDHVAKCINELTNAELLACISAAIEDRLKAKKGNGL